MFVLNTSVAAVSPMLIPNCGLITKKLLSQRSLNVALFTPHNRGFNSQYYKRSTFPVAIASSASKLRHVGCREYVTKKTEPIPATPPPTPPNLPHREQMERACFRVIALFWDCGYFIIAWLQKLIKTHVVEDPTVQHYWKRFHEKMAESKKTD